MRNRQKNIKKSKNHGANSSVHVPRHLFTSVPLLIIGLAAIIFVCVGIYKEHNRTQKIDAESARQQEIAAQINKDNALLKLSIDYFATEEAQKFEAQEIGYQSSDQEVAQVRNLTEVERALEDGTQDTQAATRADSDSGDVDNAVPHWQKWWNIFF